MEGSNPKGTKDTRSEWFTDLMSALRDQTPTQKESSQNCSEVEDSFSIIARARSVLLGSELVRSNPSGRNNTCSEGFTDLM